MRLKKTKPRRLDGERRFNTINVIGMILLSLITLYPFWYCIILSFNEGLDAIRGPLGLLPRKFTFDNYKFILNSKRVLNALGMSVLRTVVGVILTTTFTGIVAYGLSKRQIMGRKVYMMIFIVTMYFNGGMIPTYLNLKNLGLLNNFFVYVIPGMFTFYYAILFMSYFESIPRSLEEAAELDGANHFQVFFRVILPSALPIFATVALFEAVAQWNAWFDTLIYTSSDSLMTLQGIMSKMLQQTQAIQEAQRQLSAGGAASVSAYATVQPATIRVATMVVTVFPIAITYPFFQKYFVKGITLGAVKE